jgi:hypothetical protein
LSKRLKERIIARVHAQKRLQILLIKKVYPDIFRDASAHLPNNRKQEILMSLICPQCSQANQESTTFCRTCGYRFQGNEKEVGEEATIRQAHLTNVPADADPSDTLKSGLSPVAQPTPVILPPQPQVQPAPGGPAYGASTGYGAPAQPTPGQGPFFSQPIPPAQGAYAPQQQQQMYGQYPPQGNYGAPVPQQGPAAPSTLATLQRAFAGKGTPVRHQSWLVESKQVPPQTLNSAFIANLQKQGVMGVTVGQERLREQGVVMEERDYVKVRYGASAVFVYIAPMGQNLYISRTSTIQQPYSRVRIAVLATLAVLMLISLLLFVVTNSGGSGFLSALNLFFKYAFFGLLFFFIIAVLRSLVFQLTDNDFLAILRPNRLSDFSLDALASIEQTTDKALRVTLQETGLDADAIQLVQSSTPQQALHRI